MACVSDEPRRTGRHCNRGVRISHARRRCERARCGRVPVDGANEAAVTHLRATRYGGQGGFTLIELLIAVAITLLIAGAWAGVRPAARAAFDRLPAELEMQQRGRTAIDTLSQALRAANRISVANPDEAGAYAELTALI